MALTYSIDARRRLVIVVVTEQPTTNEVFKLLSRILEDPTFEPGFDVLWNRANIPSAPSAKYVEQVARWLRDRPPFRRVAMLVAASAPVAYGMARMLELLSEPGDEGRLQVFRDLDEAERWLDGSARGD